MTDKARKIGEGHAKAMGRQGLKELRASLYSESNVAQQPEYGLYGTKTQGEIADERGGKEHSRDGEQSRDSDLADRLSQAKERESEREDMVHERDKEFEMER